MKDGAPAPATELTAEQTAVLKNIETKAFDHVRRVGINGADAEDIVQKMMLAMWKNLRADPSLWAEEAENRRDGLQSTITGALIVDLRKYGQKVRERQPEEAIDLDLLPSTRSNQQERLEEKELLHSVGCALNPLGNHARTIWCALYCDGLKVREIACALHVRARAVSDSLYLTNLVMRPHLIGAGFRKPTESKS